MDDLCSTKKELGFHTNLSENFSFLKVLLKLLNLEKFEAPLAES